MQTVIIVIHLMIVIALIAVILLQRSEGGALGIGGRGGGGGMFTARGSANLLTRTTTILAIAFFVTSLGLGLLAKQQAGAPSILDGLNTTGSAPAGDGAVRGSGEGILDALQDSSGEDTIAPPTTDPSATPGSAATAPPAVPSTPAAPSGPQVPPGL